MKRIVSIIAILILSATAFSVDSFAALDDNSSGAGTVTWAAQNVTSNTTVNLRSSLRNGQNTVLVQVTGTIKVMNNSTLTIRMSSADTWTQRALIQVAGSFSGNCIFFVESGSSLVIEGLSNSLYLGIKGSTLATNLPAIYNASSKTWTKPNISGLSGQMRWPAGYGMITTQGNVTMTHCRMYDAYSEADGAALVVRRNYTSNPINYGKVNLTDVRILNCVATFGPALVIYNQCPNAGSVFVSESASVTPEYSAVTLTDCLITNNYCTNAGDNVCGVIRTGGGAYSHLTLKNTTISENYANGKGGGIVWNAHGLKNHETVCTFDGCSIINNFAATVGAGMNMSASFKFINKETKIEGNKTNGIGGGVYIPSYTGVDGLGKQTLNMYFNEYVSIKNNTAKNGGGVYVDMADTELGNGSIVNLYFQDGVNVSSNTATENGGGIYYSGNAPQLYFNMYVNGGTFKSNTAVSGGGMYFLKGANMNASRTKLYFNAGDISSCTASGSGGGVYVDGLNLQCVEKSEGEVGVNIVSNTADVAGGGLYITGETSEVTVNSGSISSNTSNTDGGGVFVDAGLLKINKGVIGSNTASGNAGGIYVNGTSDFTFNDGTISNNTSGEDGGGIYISNSNFTMNSGHVYGNKCLSETGEGGGIFCTDGSVMSITGGMVGGDSQEYANKSYNGAGIFVVNSSLTMNQGTVKYNKTLTPLGAGANAGGIYVKGTSDFTFNDGTISNNTSGVHGGGIYVAGCNSFLLDGGVVSDNEAGTNGGGIFLSANSKNVSISGGTIRDNEAAANGGGLVVAANATVSGGEISGNSAARGGGISQSGAVITINGGSVLNNTASNLGAGVYIYNSGTCNFVSGTISGNIPEEDVSDLSGGGVYVYEGHFSMEGGLITENQANLGAGIYVGTAARASFAEGSITGNDAKSHGGGVYLEGSSSCTFSKGNIKDNKAVNGGGVYMIGTSTMTFSDGVIRNNRAETTGSGYGTAYANDLNVQGAGGGIYLTGSARFEFDPNSSVGLFGNMADMVGDDLVMTSSSASVVLPDVSAMNLTDYNSKTSELFWVEDYMTDDTAYDSGTKIAGAGHKAVRYRDAIAAQSTVYKVPAGTYSGKYLALSIGYEVIYVTLKKSGLLPGESAVFRISRVDNAETTTTYSELLMTGVAGGAEQTRTVALYSGTWKVEELPWTWSYDALPAIKREITGSSTAEQKTFTFVNNKRSDLPKHAEDIVVNDFGAGAAVTGSYVNSGSINDLQNTTDYQLK